MDDAQKCVAGVDGSERIADVAKRLVSANKLATNQGSAISVVQGRLEQLDKLPADKVGLFHTHILHALLHTFTTASLLGLWTA